MCMFDSPTFDWLETASIYSINWRSAGEMVSLSVPIGMTHPTARSSLRILPNLSSGMASPFSSFSSHLLAGGIRVATESTPKWISERGGTSGCTPALAAAADKQQSSQDRVLEDGNGTMTPTWDELVMERVLFSAQDLDMRVEELANVISEDFSDRSLAVVGVATGAFMFLADLVRKIKVPVTVDLIRVQSYGNSTQAGDSVNLTTDIKIDVKGKHVLLVEDIIDRGVTLSTIITHFLTKGVATVSVCTLLDKSSGRVVPLKLTAGGKYYCGFQCPNEFVVGYGMDFAEEYRSLPYVGELTLNRKQVHIPFHFHLEY